jgi:16S rRNA (cytidine1402-2'-O)-methyltransferase
MRSVPRFRLLGCRRSTSASSGSCRAVSDAPYTLIFFEAPHRIVATLSDLNEIMPARQLAVCRNLSKYSEQVIRGNAKSVLDALAERPPQGELTVVVDGASGRPTVSAGHLSTELMHFARQLAVSQVPSKLIASALAAATGLSRREAFALAVSLKGERDG